MTALHTHDEQLLSELLAGLTGPGAQPTLSVGIVGSETHAPQPPAHCLQTCLGGDATASPTLGCAFLKAALAGRIAPDELNNDRCDRGYQVAGQPTAVSGGTAVLLTIEGQVPNAAAPVGAADLIKHLENVGRVLTRMDQLAEENAGFANEVLQNYEQLNLIFDLTQQIAQVTDAEQIEKLLLQRVGGLLHVESVAVVSPSDELRVFAVGPDGRPGTPPMELERLQDAIASTRAKREVQVLDVDGRPAIVGPLVRLDDQVHVVFTARSTEQDEFSSGDMLLTESILAFGGQIISNTELHERMRKMSLEVTRAMVAAIDKKDHYTSGHSERVGFLTRITAAELGLSPSEQETMEWAALLHDVGKIGIPEEILCKPGKLTEEEFEIIKQHPRMGYEILKPIAIMETILDGVLSHHEYPDGSGYPDGLSGDQIPLIARIIHVADTFDALTSTRAYRRAFSMDKAVEIIMGEADVRTDRKVAEAFFRAFDRYRESDPGDYEQRFTMLHERECENAGV
jgi:putative nucleotidyltransferase with HDIG domain